MVNMSTSIGRDFGKKSPDFLEPMVCAVKQKEATLCQTQTQQHNTHKSASVHVPAGLGFAVFVFFSSLFCVYIKIGYTGQSWIALLPELPL